MITYSKEELDAITRKGVLLGKELDRLILSKPKDTVTMGMVITAVAYLFAVRATDKNHVVALSKDIATAINALHDQKVASK
jgi:hypothetical protein